MLSGGFAKGGEPAASPEKRPKREVSSQGDFTRDCPPASYDSYTSITPGSCVSPRSRPRLIVPTRALATARSKRRELRQCETGPLDRHALRATISRGRQAD